MKIKYMIIFIILLILGNFARLYLEDKTMVSVEINEEISYKKEEAKKENDLTYQGKKYDINNVEYETLLKLGFNKSKATKIIEFRETVGIIKNIEDLKNISKFGESSYKQSKKIFIVDIEKIKNPLNNYGREFKRFNINKLNEEKLKLLGFSKKEIKKIISKIEETPIRSNLDLEEIIGEKRYIEVEKYIKFLE